ncbi:MAG: type I restriction enzyme HsdR N-terminal domain-containing protein [Candidatus Parabeggiatoa sp.]|nr:type I restriction enzyme HsdR N-terminal domain-containing protein [Candidatus Parabeggiatoa sp.]
MNIEKAIKQIVENLPKWENSINEAQTRQVIVLPILLKLGYDIWNPFEVYPEQHSGGGLGSHIPDFKICFNQKTHFIVEVKALNKKFTANEQKQAVNYVNSEGLRWAILTNGKKWLFFDNEQKGKATDKLVFQFDITEEAATNYFKLLLSTDVWKSADASQHIRQNIEIIELSKKLKDTLSTGFEKSEAGLKLAIQYTLDGNERQLAETHFVEILSLVSLNGNHSSSQNATSSYKQDESNKIIPLLRDKIEQASQHSKHEKIEIAQLNNSKIKVKNWRDILVGVIETLIALEQESSISSKDMYESPSAGKIKKKGEPYSDNAYRQLSNGKYLFVGMNHIVSQQKINHYLNTLNIDTGILEITYENNHYHLPR